MEQNWLFFFRSLFLNIDENDKTSILFCPHLLQWRYLCYQSSWQGAVIFRNSPKSLYWLYFILLIVKLKYQTFLLAPCRHRKRMDFKTHVINCLVNSLFPFWVVFHILRTTYLLLSISNTVEDLPRKLSFIPFYPSGQRESRNTLQCLPGFQLPVLQVSPGSLSCAWKVQG